jgi:hypothetical protein
MGAGILWTRRLFPTVAVALSFLGQLGCRQEIEPNAVHLSVFYAAKPAPPYSKFQRRHADFTPEEQTRVDDNCLMGIPKRDEGFQHGPTRYIIRDGYVLEHSSVDKSPLWVCDHLTKSELVGQLARTNPFAADPLIPRGDRSELVAYRGSLSPPTDPVVGMRVLKSGVQTGITEAEIIEVDPTGRIQLDRPAPFPGSAGGSAAYGICDVGDSGAVWVERETLAPVALHTGTLPLAGTGAGISLRVALQSLGLQMFSG